MQRGRKRSRAKAYYVRLENEDGTIDFYEIMRKGDIRPVGNSRQVPMSIIQQQENQAGTVSDEAVKVVGVDAPPQESVAPQVNFHSIDWMLNKDPIPPSEPLSGDVLPQKPQLPIKKQMKELGSTGVYHRGEMPPIELSPEDVPRF